MEPHAPYGALEVEAEIQMQFVTPTCLALSEALPLPFCL